jgi:HK97 family phage major capsid protein/HK97 family phage prohead protease
MTDKTLKLGKLTRDVPCADIVVRTNDKGTRTLSFPASSETPIDRWYGTEVLRHDKKSLRMERLNGGAAPLLFNHRWSDPVGMIDGARIEDGRLMVDAHLFDTERGKEMAAMIDGGLRNVSIGYELYVVEEDKKANRFTATDWGVLEVSMVTVPADITVGIGRSEGADELREVRVVSVGEQTPSPTAASPAAPRERQTMTVATDAAAGANAEVKPLDPLQVEKDRRQAIGALCKANNIDARVEDQWVRDGVRLETIAGKILEVIEERGKSRPTAASDLGLSRAETQRFSVFKAIRAMRTPSVDNMNAAAYELECSRAVAKRIGREDSGSIFVPGEVLQRPLGEAATRATRAMATTPGASGGYLVNVENMGFIDILRNRSVVMNMGARRLPGLVGNVVFPRQTGKATVVWQGGEGVSVTASDQTLGQLSMTPKTAIAITDVSEQLLRQSTPSAEAFIMADLAADIAIDGVDNKAINGVGGAEPLGIKNTTGISSGQDAATATYAKILAFVSTAGANNAIRGNPGFITTTAGASVLMQKQRFSSTDTPVWEGNMMDGTLVGFRAMSSEQLASGNLIFGSFDELVIGEWGVLELAMDNGGTRFNQAQVGIRAMWMVDVLLRYPQSFVVSTNLSA